MKSSLEASGPGYPPYRQLDTKRLAAQSQAGDLHAGDELMVRPGTPAPEPADDAIPIPAESG